LNPIFFITGVVVAIVGLVGCVYENLILINICGVISICWLIGIVYVIIIAFSTDIIFKRNKYI